MHSSKVGTNSSFLKELFIFVNDLKNIRGGKSFCSILGQQNFDKKLSFFLSLILFGYCTQVERGAMRCIICL